MADRPHFQLLEFYIRNLMADRPHFQLLEFYIRNLMADRQRFTCLNFTFAIEGPTAHLLGRPIE